MDARIKSGHDGGWWGRPIGCRSLRLSLILLLLAAPAAAGAPELEYVYPDQSIWTTRLDARGEPVNPLLDFATILLGRAGVSWHGRGYPAARMFERLRAGSDMFSLLVKSPLLDECCLVGRKPVAATELRVYRRAGTPPVLDRGGLAGHTVITIRGYSYGGLRDFLRDPANRIVLSATARHEAAFAMLAAGRGDYLLDYPGPAAEVLAENPVPGLAFDLLRQLDIHIVLSRRYPDASALMARLEAIAETLAAEGGAR